MTIFDGAGTGVITLRLLSEAETPGGPWYAWLPVTFYPLSPLQHSLFSFHGLDVHYSGLSHHVALTGTHIVCERNSILLSPQ